MPTVITAGTTQGSFMSRRKSIIIIVGSFLLSFTCTSPKASPGIGESEAEPQISRGIALPVWGPGEMRGNIDIRIWPDDMVLWLERETIRRRCQDPSIPEEERQNLRHLVARQLGWGRRWVNE